MTSETTALAQMIKASKAGERGVVLASRHRFLHDLMLDVMALLPPGSQMNRVTMCIVVPNGPTVSFLAVGDGRDEHRVRGRQANWRFIFDGGVPYEAVAEVDRQVEWSKAKKETL